MQRAFSLAAALMLGAAMPNMAHAAPDNTLGMALLSARVFPNGVFGSSGLVSSENTSTGSYLLTFNRNIFDCQPVVTPFAAEPVTVRFFSIGGSPTQGSLGVAISRISNGTPIDAHISVVVFCPK
jgi:hypothetical protein